MILIEVKEQSQLAFDFFDEVIGPIAQRERAAGKSFFPLGFDPEAETYFSTPVRKVMKREDFELRAADSLEKFVAELCALWTQEGNEELAAMAPRLLELARQMASRPQPEAEELSPFMYAMF